MSQYKKTHLSIDWDAFANANYVEPTPGLSTIEVAPDFETFLPLFEAVGSPWDWHRRPKYAEDAEKLKARVETPGTRLYLLQKHGQTIGYCLTTSFTHDLKYAFNKKAGAAVKREQICEIENFGLFPEHTGNGYGPTFLQSIFEDLFEDYERVYLTTRSTNHSRVIPFYERLGMFVTHEEQKPDDLLPRDQS